jgi:hypothetical protein
LKILNEHCNYKEGDRPLSPEIEKITMLVRSGHIMKDVTKTLRLE